MAVSVAFIECTSLNVSYNVMGIAQVSYTVVHNDRSITAFNSVTAGGRTFRGYVTDAFMSAIPKTTGWYETHVTLISTTN